MKKKYIFTLLVFVAIITFCIIYLNQNTYCCYLELRENVFINTGCDEDDKEQLCPIEIMLSEYSIDTVNLEKTQIKLYLQPIGNKEPEKIDSVITAVNYSINYGNYNLAVEKYAFIPEEQRLYLTLIVCEKRINKWLK